MGKREGTRKRKSKSKGNGERKRKNEGKGKSGRRKKGRERKKGGRGDGESKRVNSTATSSPTRAPRRPSPARPGALTPVTVHEAPAARLQDRVAARLALEVQPDGQHAAGAVVVEHDLGDRKSVV